MAYGHELIIGFKGKEKINEIAAQLGFRYQWKDYSGDEVPETALDAINEQLRAPWVAAMTELGLEVVGNDDAAPYMHPSHARRYFIVNTPAGPRKMIIWDLCMYYDPMECGDNPEDAVFGVSLISRYYPTFLDWAREHGGSGGVLTIDQLALEAIKVARKHIEGVLPLFVDADIHIKELHY